MLQPGEHFAGKYRIERLLGQGGMGAVYVAVNERLQKHVALKILSREIASEPGAAERFVREGIAASRARHPGIVEIFDADTHDGLPWIAMELLNGESLGDRMRRGPIECSDAISIVREALGALAAVHRAGIIHRDLKPDNLFLERLPEGSRRVKILDFGIARANIGELGRLTATGMAIGTPDYLAPEQASGQAEIDGRVDVYAIGVILYELITGQVPYRAQSFGELVRLMYTHGPRPIVSLAPNVPHDLAQVIDACLMVDRDRRIPSVEALSHALAALNVAPAVMAPTQPMSAQPMSAPTVPISAPPSRSPMPIAIAVVVVAMLGLGGIAVLAFFALQPSEPRTEVAAVERPAAPPPAPAPPPVVPLTEDEFSRDFNRQFAMLRACRGERGVQGQISVRMTIERGGDVSSSETIVNETGDEAYGACVANTARNMRFRAVPGSAPQTFVKTFVEATVGREPVKIRIQPGSNTTIVRRRPSASAPPPPPY